MSRIVATFASIIFLPLTVFAVAAEAAPILHARERVENQYIVVLKPEVVTKKDVTNVAWDLTLRHGGRLLGLLKNATRGFGVELPAGAVNALAADPRISHVEENRIGHYSYTTEYYSDSTSHWQLDRIDQYQKIADNPTHAYAYTSTGSGVDVYVVDSGIQKQHSEFQRDGSTTNVTSGADYAGGDGYAPDNPCGGFANLYNAGHGTAVASVIAGQTAGVARDATLIPVKISPCTTQDNGAFTALSVLYSLDWIYDQVQLSPSRRAVVNMSIYFSGVDPRDSSCGISWDCRDELDYNVQQLIAQNVVVVASANNQNGNLCGNQAPADLGYGGANDNGLSTTALPIVVGGIDINDARYTCSTCDTRDGGSNYGPCVDIWAPAKNMRVAHIASSTAYRGDTSWITAYNSAHGTNATVENTTTGTSFAAPIVTGSVARLLQSYPSLSVRGVWDFLKLHSTAVTADFDNDGTAETNLIIYMSPLY